MRWLGWALVQYDWCPCKKNEKTETHWRDQVNTQEREGWCKARSEASGETSLLTPWSWTACLQNYEKINVFCVSHRRCILTGQRVRELSGVFISRAPITSKNCPPSNTIPCDEVFTYDFWRDTDSQNIVQRWTTLKTRRLKIRSSAEKCQWAGF